MEEEEEEGRKDRRKVINIKAGRRKQVRKEGRKKRRKEAGKEGRW
jgi:hypothetical protein